MAETDIKDLPDFDESIQDSLQEKGEESVLVEESTAETTETTPVKHIPQKRKIIKKKLTKVEKDEQSAIRIKRSEIPITKEFITSVLRDKYHNYLLVNDIKTKYGISQDIYKSIDETYSDLFLKQFGKHRKMLPVEELQEYWVNLSLD